MADIVRYERLTVSALKALQARNAVLMLSFGSVEQHSAHLPVGTDSLCSQVRAERIAARTGSVVFAPLALGYSFNHLGMFGTVSLKAETLVAVAEEVLEQLCAQGWRRFLVFSGHAGNWSALELAGQKVRERYPQAAIVFARGLPPVDEARRRERFLREFDWHAGRIETALLGHYFPELVDKDKLPPGNQLPSPLARMVAAAKDDVIDETLVKAMTPQRTEDVTRSGNWGVKDPASFAEVPVADAMAAYEDFFVRLIRRWDELEALR